MKLTGENIINKPKSYMYEAKFINYTNNDKLIKNKVKEAYKSIKDENGENMGNNIKDARIDTIMIKPPLETYEMHLFDDKGNLKDNI